MTDPTVPVVWQLPLELKIQLEIDDRAVQEAFFSRCWAGEDPTHVLLEMYVSGSAKKVFI